MPSSLNSHHKKRRREDDDVDGDLDLPFPHGYYSHEQHQHPQHHAASPRKIIPYPSPLSKRIRLSTSTEEQQPFEETYLSQHHTRLPSRQPTPPKTVNLSPCHICHRKPTKKSDLDSYADCESCGERTCYICIRQCLERKSPPASATYDHHVDLMRDEDRIDYTEADEYKRNRAPSDLERAFGMEDASSWEQKRQGIELRTTHGGVVWDRGRVRVRGRGHWGRICSQCCVERGPEGEVICLGCLET